MRRWARADALSGPVVGAMVLLLVVVLARSSTAIVGAVDKTLEESSLRSVTEKHLSLTNKFQSTNGMGEPAASRELGLVGEGR